LANSDNAATTVGLTLLTSYMASFAAPAAVGSNAAEPAPTSLQDYLTRPIA
jgi:hypothetical protein